MFREIQLL